MKKKVNFRYLVDKYSVGSGSHISTKMGLFELEILEISEIGFKVRDCISGKIWWQLNENDFRIIEVLHNDDDVLYPEVEVLKYLRRYANFLQQMPSERDVKMWFLVNKLNDK